MGCSRLSESGAGAEYGDGRRGGFEEFAASCGHGGCEGCLTLDSDTAGVNVAGEHGRLGVFKAGVAAAKSTGVASRHECVRVMLFLLQPHSTVKKERCAKATLVIDSICNLMPGGGRQITRGLLMEDVLTRVSQALAERYRIEREVGAGAMATVYLAHDLKHNREVALKVLRPELAAMLGTERFLNEIAITARLDHPHILTLIDSGTADGFLYYVLPFVRGESLRQRLQREKYLSLEDALAITKQVGSALEYAHRQGVIHRDVKPENILVHEGEAMLTDFGIALAVTQAGGHRLTETGRSPGTPQYMSPEQATGERLLDARSDVYSLAVVLYEMLASEPPHTGANAQVIIAKLLTERPIKLRVLRETVPDGIEAAVGKALAIVPADRYRDAGEFVRALSVPPTHGRAPAQWRWVAVAAGTVLVVTAIGAGVLISRRKPPLPPIDRIQLTATGNASYPSISANGSRLAFGEKQCDADGNCIYRLVIQKVDGTSRLVIADSLAVLLSTEWTPDGDYIIYGASYGSERWGMFAASTLGDKVRFFGCCLGVPLSGDTVLFFRYLPVGDTVISARLATASSGLLGDSIPIRQPGAGLRVIPTPYTNRLLAFVESPNGQAPKLRLIDYKGETVDESTAGFSAGDRQVVVRGMPERGELLVAVQHEPAGDEYDFLRFRFNDKRIEPGIDTVLQRIAIGNGSYSVSRDGARLAYATGPVETSIWAVDRGMVSFKPDSSRQLFTTTAVAFARISPAGDRVLFGKQVVYAGRRRFQLFITPVASWHESQVTAPLEDLVDAQWTRDASRIVYANGAGARIHVVEVDSAGGQARDIGNVDGSPTSRLGVLRDGGVAVTADDGRSIRVVGRPGIRDLAWRAPPWIGFMSALSASPDGASLGVLGWDRALDSAIVAQVNLRTGAFTRRGVVAAEDIGNLAWLDDQSLMFDIRETRGTQGLYAIRRDGAPTRVISLPHAPGKYSLSSDGRHFIAVSRSDKTDVYMIKNFGDFLKR